MLTGLRTDTGAANVAEDLDFDNGDTLSLAPGALNGIYNLAYAGNGNTPNLTATYGWADPATPLFNNSSRCTIFGTYAVVT